ncbi:MAG: imm11 family protein [Anaerolineae bacterium]
MKVYTLEANYNNYHVLAPVGSGTLELYRRFNGQRMETPPEHIEVEVAEPGQGLPGGDFPGLASHIPVFSSKSMHVLGQLLSSVGETIPLQCENCDDTYIALNVTRLIDALDERRSTVKRYTSSGRIMRILRYAFLEEAVSGETLFKIPETVLQEVYATEVVIEKVAQSDLRGFVFKLIWTNEAAVILCPYCMGIITEETEICPTCGLDTRQDAALEMTLDELRDMKRKPCPYCGTRIHVWADPCPYCKRGKQRQGLQEGVVIV